MFRVDARALIADLTRIDHGIRAAAQQSLGQAAAFARELARQTTKFKDRSRRLRGSIVRIQRGTFRFIVQAGGRVAPWGRIVEGGSKAHDIRPKRTGSVSSRRPANRAMPNRLRFQVNGRWVSARVVKHPGTQPTHFMRDARDQAEAKLQHFAVQGVDRAVHG